MGLLKRSKATAKALCVGTGLNEQFTLGLLYIYGGPVPASADVALDMVAAHTEVVIISDNDTGDGLTFDAPNDSGTLPKDPAQTWLGTNTFDGLHSADTDIVPTFYRLCAAGDNGRGLANTATGYRIQGTVGGPSSGADLEVGVVPMVAGNPQPIGAFGITIAGA